MLPNATITYCDSERFGQVSGGCHVISFILTVDDKSNQSFRKLFPCPVVVQLFHCFGDNKYYQKLHNDALNKAIVL